jgi:lipopolysaccharide transport protein LptA
MVATRTSAVVACALGLIAAGEAETADPERGAVAIDAASSDVDYRTSTVTFRDVVITQDGVRVAAERAQASGLDFDRSTWRFTGNVRIDVDGGRLTSNEASVDFLANRVRRATIRGTPAEFEQQVERTGNLARGRAGRIEYDLDTGTVTLRESAFLTDGRNEINGEQLVYSVREQRVQAQAKPGADERVRIIIRPGEGAAPAPAPPVSPSAPTTPRP